MAVWSKINYSAIIDSNRIDADYYKPEYLFIQNLLNRYYPLVHYISQLIHPSEFKRIYSSNGTTVIRAQNVRPLAIELDNNEVFIQNGLAKLLTKNKVLYGDILITRTGANFGQTSLYTDERENAIVTSHTLILRLNNGISSSYVALFLNTTYGRKMLDRGMYGSSQPEIAPKLIKKIPIPRFKEEVEIKLGDKVTRAYQLKKKAISLYKKATQLLEEALGLDKIEFKREKCYAASFSEVINYNRADSDYYQTKYRQLNHHLNSLYTKSIGSICNISKGIEVGSDAYQEKGPLFIRVSNLTKHGIEVGNSDKYISTTLYNSLKEYQPNLGDILLTKDGTIGVCYIVDEFIQGIISGGILKLNLLDTKIPKEYLALVINSKICQMQAQRDCSGALILHWKPDQIRKLQ